MTSILSSSQYRCTPSSPKSLRFITTAKGRFNSLTMPTANFRSFKPNGVGSVTSKQISAPLTASITGHEVPGGASIMTIPSFAALSLTFFIKAGDRTSPILSRPCTNLTLSAVPDSTNPIGFCVSVMAPVGQTSIQPPHEWHNCSKTSGMSFKHIMALYWQS